MNIACTRPALIEWVRNRASRVRRKASVCSGAFLLAEPGVLDGRRAVTHWHRCDEFAGRYPQVGLERDPIFLRDGVIWTSTGVTAGIDLALLVVEGDHGRALALAVARELVVVGKQPGGQSPYSAPLKLQAADDRFSDLNAWVSANLAGSLTNRSAALSEWWNYLAPAAASITAATSAACDAKEAWLPSTVVSLALIRSAKNACAWGSRVRS